MHELDRESLSYVKVFNDLAFLLLLKELLGLSNVIRIIRSNLLRNASSLSSKDVRNLYDSAYISMLGSRKPVKSVNGCPVNEYSTFAFDYLNQVEVKDNKCVIDYGSGSGELCFALASIGFNVTGLDINPSVISHCNSLANKLNLKDNLHFCRIIDDTIDIPENCDYVILTDVVEHLSIAELKHIFGVFKRKLKKNGHLIIRTPNGLLNPICKKRLILADALFYIKLIKTRFLSEHDQLNALIDAYHEQTHINVMLPSDLLILLKQCGFSNITTSYFKDVPFNLHKLRMSGSVGIIATH